MAVFCYPAQDAAEDTALAMERPENATCWRPARASKRELLICGWDEGIP
jgi:hypothetical protein